MHLAGILAGIEICAVPAFARLRSISNSACRQDTAADWTPLFL